MASKRDIALAMISGAAAAWAGRFQPDLTRDDALEQIRAISDDPDVLAESAAIYAAPMSGPVLQWHPDAVSLLVEAGANPDLVEQYAAERRNRKPAGFNLSTFAEGINALDSAHGPTKD